MITGEQVRVQPDCEVEIEYQELSRSNCIEEICAS